MAGTAGTLSDRCIGARKPREPRPMQMTPRRRLATHKAPAICRSVAPHKKPKRLRLPARWHGCRRPGRGCRAQRRLRGVRALVDGEGRERGGPGRRRRLWGPAARPSYSHPPPPRSRRIGGHFKSRVASCARALGRSQRATGRRRITAAGRASLEFQPVRAWWLSATQLAGSDTGPPFILTLSRPSSTLPRRLARCHQRIDSASAASASAASASVVRLRQ